ncbi:hypothetical protein RB151_015250 [Providencia rettgeri]|nr:hypothetical protein RB151_015250 [Providencia rettgeri]
MKSAQGQARFLPSVSLAGVQIEANKKGRMSDLINVFAICSLLIDVICIQYK